MKKLTTSRRVTRIFLGQGSFLVNRALLNNSPAALERKALQGKNRPFFELETLKF